MRVHAQRDRAVLVAELTTHVRDRGAILEQQTRKRVSHLVRAPTMQARGIEHAVEHLADVGLIERRACHRRKDPHGEWLTVLQPRGMLSKAPETKLRAQLAREIDLTPLMILRSSEETADQVPANLEGGPAPVDIAPLEPEEFAGTQTCPKAAQQPRIPVRELQACDAQQVGHFVSHEGINGRFLMVGGPQVPAQTERGIRWQHLVFDCLGQDGAQRSRDPPHGRHLESLFPTRSDHVAAFGSPDTRHRYGSERGQKVLLQMADVETKGAGLQVQTRLLQPRLAVLFERDGGSLGDWQAQVGATESVAQVFCDANRRLMIPDPLRAALAVMVHEDPPGTAKHSDLDTHYTSLRNTSSTVELTV